MSSHSIAYTIIFIAIATITTGCGGKFAEKTAMRSDAPCPKTYNGFEKEAATSADVIACLGEPSHKDYNDDGRYSYLYRTKDNITYTYAFSTSGKLQVFNAWGLK